MHGELNHFGVNRVSDPMEISFYACVFCPPVLPVPVAWPAGWWGAPGCAGGAGTGSSWAGSSAHRTNMTKI